MRLHVYPVAGHEDEITSVECISVPATIRDIATIRGASSLGDPTDYPTEGSVWADSGHQLYQSTTLSNNHWIVSVKPKAIMKVGDTFTIRVHYTGGGYQDFYLTTAYVLTDWARISTYYSATMTSTVGTRVASEVATFNTSSLEVVFTKPLDEDGNVLDGLHYSIIAGFVTDEASGDETLPVPGVSNDIEYQATAYPASFTEGIDTITVSLHELVTFEAGSYYYITPVAESADGQRNGEEYWFKKL